MWRHLHIVYNRKKKKKKKKDLTIIFMERVETRKKTD